jgi:hypothetical protein
MSGQRPDRYFWVRTDGTWQIAELINGTYRLDDINWPASAFDEIGPPCSRDADEQLAKAREVLGRMVWMAENGGVFLRLTVKDMIEESGVRL